MLSGIAVAGKSFFSTAMGLFMSHPADLGIDWDQCCFINNMSNNTYEYIRMSLNNVNKLAPVFRLLGEPNRLRILCSLGLECRPVSDIIKDTGMTQTNVSFHLRLLREAGLVRPERRGAFVYYCLPDTELLEIFNSMSEWLDQKSWKGREEIEVANERPGEKHKSQDY